MHRIFRVLKNIGLIIFFGWTVSLVVIYFMALWEKIVRPEYKNMNNKQVIFFGLLATAFIGLDILILKRFIWLLRRNNASHKEQ